MFSHGTSITWVIRYLEIFSREVGGVEKLYINSNKLKLEFKIRII